MKKCIISLAVCFSISTFIFAGEVETITTNSSTEIAMNDIKIMPRFFSDKLFVSTHVQTSGLYTLFLYSEKGVCVAKVPVDLSNGDFVYFTQNLRTGNYTYFIRENKQLVVKGTFVK